MAAELTKNGWVDDGKSIRSARKNCPNCGSSNYIESVSLEKCHDCGLQFNYWGAGGNDVYLEYQAKEHHRQDQEDREQSYDEEY